MKQIVLLSAFLFSFCSVFADSTSNKSHQIGINLCNQSIFQFPYSRHLDHTSQVSIGRGLMYKYQINNFRIRSTWDYYNGKYDKVSSLYDYESRNIGEYSFSEFRLGVEYGFGNGLFQPYTGIDLLARFGSVSGEYRGWSWSSFEYIYNEKIRDYGLSGTFGLNMQLHKRFNFNIEASIMIYSIDRTPKNYNFNRGEAWVSYNLPRFIGISYLF
jgi:hypothetical protein